MISVPKGTLTEVIEMGGDLRWAPIWYPMEHRQSAYLRCSSGHLGGLDSHSIAADGSVVPRVVCVGGKDGDRCEFNEAVILEGWDPEETRPK